MTYFCGVCGTRSEQSGRCSSCGRPMASYANSALETTMVDISARLEEDPHDRILHLLREAWRRGAPSPAQEEMLQRERARLGVEPGVFYSLDLLARAELGMLTDTPANTAVKIAIRMEGPAVAGQDGTVEFEIRNTAATDFKAVRLRLESSFLEHRSGLDPFPLQAGETRRVAGVFHPTAATGPNGAPVRLTVEVEDTAGVCRVYRPEDRIRIPIRAAGAKDKAGEPILLRSAAGGLSRAELEYIDIEAVAALRRNAAQALSRVDMACLSGLGDAVAAAFLARNKEWGVSVPLCLDRERTEELGLPRVEPDPADTPAEPVERALLQITDNGVTRRMHFMAKPVTVFGRPLGQADVWLHVWNRDAKPDLDLTGRVSSKHFAIRHDGLFYIRDLGSANGVRVNDEMLGDAWRPLGHRDRIVLSRGILALTALTEMTRSGQGAPPVCANLRLIREVAPVEEYILLPEYIDIGSAPDCPIRLGGATELNARLAHAGGCFWIVNLDSAGNVAVDGEPLPLHQPKALEDNQKIHIGETEIAVSLS